MDGGQLKKEQGIPDSELVIQIKAGNREAFALLYERYGEALYRIIWQKTSNKDDARDILHDVFERIWANRTQLPSELNVFSYLFRSVHNRSLDLARRELSKQKYVASFERFVREHPQSFNQSLEVQELMTLVTSTLATLPENTRKVMEFRILAGLNNKEIAKILELSDDSVKSHVKRGMKVLREKEKFWIFFTFFCHFS